MAHGHTRMFIRQLIENPGSTGALIPSSDKLAREIVKFADPSPDDIIVELGPGTGSFTRRIVETLRPEQKFFAVEVNGKFAKTLQRQMPGLHLHVGDASDLATFCAQEGVDHVDCVISGLPWAIIPEDAQNNILDAMLKMLSPGGIFVTFAYLQGLVMPAARKFKKTIKRRFVKVEASGVVWMNVPPAIIYRCRK